MRHSLCTALSRRASVAFSGLLFLAVSTCAQSLTKDVQQNGTKVTASAARRTVGIWYTFGQQHQWKCTEGCMENEKPVYEQGENYGMPWLGFYDNRQKKIIDQHAKWLADAGIDYVVLDYTNGMGASRVPCRWKDDPCWDAAWTACRMGWNRTRNNNPPWGPWNHCGEGEIEDGGRAFIDRMAWRKSRGKKYVEVTVAVGTEGYCKTLHPNRNITHLFNRMKARYVDNPYYRTVWHHRNNKPFILLWLAGCATHGKDGPVQWNRNKRIPFRNRAFEWRYLDSSLSGRNLVVNKAKGDYRSLYRSWSLFENEGPIQAWAAKGGMPDQMTVSPARRSPDGGYNSWWACKGDGSIFRKDFELARQRNVQTILLSLWNGWSRGEAERSAECSFTFEPDRHEGGYGFKYLNITKEEVAKFKASTGPPPVPGPGFNSIRKLVAYHNGKCAVVQKKTKRVVVGRCRGKGRVGKWRVIDAGDGAFVLKYLVYKRCLDSQRAMAGASAEGAQLYVARCKSESDKKRNSQLFRLRMVSVGLYALESIATGLALEVLPFNVDPTDGSIINGSTNGSSRSSSQTNSSSSGGGGNSTAAGGGSPARGKLVSNGDNGLVATTFAGWAPSADTAFGTVELSVSEMDAEEGVHSSGGLPISTKFLRNPLIDGRYVVQRTFVATPRMLWMLTVP